MDDPLMVRWRKALGEASLARERFKTAEEELRRSRIMLTNKEAQLIAATSSLTAAEEQAEAEAQAAKARAAEADDTDLPWQHR